jgi:hypothetical protein
VIRSASEALDAAQFVLSEIVRIDSLSVEERLERIRADWREGLAFLSAHSDFPHLECGHAAMERLRALVHYVRKIHSPLRDEASFSTVWNAVEWRFVEVFVKHRRPITPSSVSSVLQKAANSVMKKREHRTVVIPCVLWLQENPPTFMIGPVGFSRTKAFFADPANALRKADSQVGAKARALSEEAGWVATVTVSTMDDETAEERARACVDAAIGVLKLFLEPRRMRRCRRADAWGPTPTHGLFLRQSDGSLAVSLTMQGSEELGWENWAECFEGQSGALMRIAEAAVAGLVNARPEYPLQSRLLDALKWFSDGASDSSLSARLTKYVFAWERLVITRKHSSEGGDGVTDAVCRRVAILCERILGEPRGQALLDEIDGLYDLRSRLAHGSASPWDESEVCVYSVRAEELTVRALLGAILHYYSLSQGAASDRELETSFEASSASAAGQGSVGHPAAI